MKKLVWSKNLVQSFFDIKKEALGPGPLQSVIGLLISYYSKCYVFPICPFVQSSYNKIVRNYLVHEGMKDKKRKDWSRRVKKEKKEREHIQVFVKTNLNLYCVCFLRKMVKKVQKWFIRVSQIPNSKTLKLNKFYPFLLWWISILRFTFFFSFLCRTNN